MTLTPEQEQLRAGRITSSIVADVLGVGLDGPLTAWQKIRGEVPFEGNENTKRGSLLEEAILQSARDEGWDFDSTPGLTAQVEDWAADSPDGIGPGCVAEAKSVAMGVLHRWGEPGTDQVPDYVIVQCAWHMWAQDKPRCVVPVLFGGYDFAFKLFVLERSGELEDKVVPRARVWWERHIRDGVMPEPNHGDGEAIMRQWPGPKWKDAQLSDVERGEALYHASLYKSAHLDLKACEQRKTDAGNKLRAILGDAEFFSAEGHTIKWAMRGKSRVLTVS